MRNIDLFNLHVAEVLGICFESFPVRPDIRYEDLGKNVYKRYASGTDEELFYNAQEYEELAAATVNWLTDAGYLWVGKKVYGAVKSVTLTPKSLELLNATPQALEMTESVGTILANGSKTLGRETALSVIRSVLAEGAKLAFSGNI
ncbi:hypothetical protein CLH62_19640 [Marinobacter guineae]|uniref:Uncharacterized protein n=1 Tax=Marinobacter guineae TaxID=432303 RepID=A0A2G1VAC2_9GAMM|nr:hypothetical protein [Marinobacter guineae]PHQ23685.1 hypothetical protein CLH62_19640 [Marinobacter guineae]